MTPEFLGCKICRGSSVYLCDTYNEHSRTSILHHYRCIECGIVFVGNLIDEEELREAYSTLKVKEYYEEIKHENRKKYEMCINDLSGLVSKGSKIVDIGTGNGEFVEMLIDDGFDDISCHEIPGSDLSNVQALGCTVYRDFDYSTIPSNTFDVVTLLDVAEHVPDPPYLFSACNWILRQGGIVYFHTPIVTRIDRVMHRIQRLPIADKIGQAWQRSRTSIFHLQNYTTTAVGSLLRGAGFGKTGVRLRNELSWPVSTYVKVYLCEKHGLPGYLAPVFTPFLYPLIRSNFLNANKAIVWAEKVRTVERWG